MNSMAGQQRWKKGKYMMWKRLKQTKGNDGQSAASKALVECGVLDSQPMQSAGLAGISAAANC